MLVLADADLEAAVDGAVRGLVRRRGTGLHFDREDLR